MAEQTPKDIETAPDPEEDDLDDLDDVLDQFQASKPSDPQPSAPTNPASTKAPTASGPGRPPGPGIHDEKQPSEQEFAAQLQEGMKSMIGELDANPEMQREFEKMMEELIAAGRSGSDAEAAEHIGKATEAIPSAQDAPPVTTSRNTAEGGAGKGSKKGGSDDFQETIRKTMERMQNSSSEASAAAQAGGGGSEEDMLAQMMRELSNGGGAGEEDFNKMLMSMMTQLTNKEILYEPMKELHDKFPAWMEKNAAGTGKADLDRYREQQSLVKEIVGRFERKGYSDDNENDREYIVERMQKVRVSKLTCCD